MWVAVLGVRAQQQMPETLGLLRQQQQPVGEPCLPPRGSKLTTNPCH